MSLPSTLDFDRFLWRKMAICFIENTRRSYGYALSRLKRLPVPSQAGKLGSLTVRTDDSSQAGISFSLGSLVKDPPDLWSRPFHWKKLYSVILAIDHFSLHIEPVKPKHPGYTSKEYTQNTAIALPREATQHETAGPYSPVLIVDPGKLVVLSGQAAIDPKGRIIGDNIGEQTHYMLENCRNLLSTAGCGMDDVFKVTVYLKNIDDWSAFNEIYKTYFNKIRPVRTAIQTGLIGGLLVEIEIWAVKS